ncbi:prepilin-type N-terminal cleavage/methylation domain-containing protein [Sulfurimonas sp. SAG-AH-194-C20]|nr:prepilin-type N-terminal cleavage/methylation domain-containing protein [Sulfurimonas sp. SAG-AH-194-C20]MDF1878185.1 prepilin-type N-terminal cleavage/methylation domain-containing protein [Sulfurimonas sp. SAG-AH-194-C20]
MKKSAFTLIELLISIIILTILMLFLYKSYANLNRSNSLLNEEVEKISKIEKIKKTLLMDFTRALNVKVLNQDTKIDITFLQTTHSLYKRINPYVGYIVKDKKLYRIESLRPLTEFPLVADSEFVAEELGEVKIFRIYKSTDTKSSLYLVHLLFKDTTEILLKLNPLEGFGI